MDTKSTRVTSRFNRDTITTIIIISTLIATACIALTLIKTALDPLFGPPSQRASYATSAEMTPHDTSVMFVCDELYERSHPIVRRYADNAVTRYETEGGGTITHAVDLPAPTDDTDWWIWFSDDEDHYICFAWTTDGEGPILHLSMP